MRPLSLSMKTCSPVLLRARVRLRGWVTRVRVRVRVRSALPSPDVNKEAVPTCR